jgi:hypothetical protein
MHPNTIRATTAARGITASMMNPQVATTRRQFSTPKDTHTAHTVTQMTYNQTIRKGTRLVTT